jgi:hypothetical protein
MKKILICAPIHEEKDIFELYLKHLRSLEIPADVEVSRFFVLHNCEHLKELLNEDEQCFINNNESEYKKDDNTHHWQQDNFNNVVAMKNMMIGIMLREKFDYIFYVDSDLMLHKKTLVDLFEADKDMISEIFWTKWQNDGKEEEMPNAWHYDHYSFILEELQKLRHIKGHHRVGMTGACTLIKRKVLEAGVNWNPINNLTITQWEDRAFCVKATVAGFEIWTSNNYPAKHLYRRELVNEFIEGGGINE